MNKRKSEEQSRGSVRLVTAGRTIVKFVGKQVLRIHN